MCNLAPSFTRHIGRTDEALRTKKPASTSQRATLWGSRIHRSRSAISRRENAIGSVGGNRLHRRAFPLAAALRHQRVQCVLARPCGFREPGKSLQGNRSPKPHVLTR